MDSLTSARYSYDLRGALTSEEVTFGTGAASFTKKIERTYEANGLLKSLAYPDTLGTSQFIYNGNNQLAEYRLPSPGGNGGALVYQYDWNSVTQITMPGGVRREVTFDGLRRPIRIRLEGQQDTVLLDHQYTYLGAGLIQSKSSLDGIYQYDYDALGRVTKVLPPPPVVQSTENPQGLPIEEYTYDVFHNRLTSRHQPGPWLYNQDNELIEWGTNDDRRTLSYNDNGSVTLVESSDPNVPTRLYDYDTEGRMKSMREGASTTAEFSYNFMGQRISRRDSVGTTWFLYSQEGLIGEYDEQGNPIRLYGWLPGHKWGTDPVWQKDAGGFHLVHSDLESFPVLMTAATTGEKTWEARYTNFGDASAVGSWASDVRLRFPGQWIDGHIIQNGHREYDPETGRYLSQDPLGDRRNSYVYANQSPSNVTDSLGLVGLPRDGGTPLDWYLVQVFEENSHNKGDTIEVPERYCSYYMTEKMKRFARLAKERMEKDLDAGHSTAVAECSLLKFWTLAGERELNEHEVFALKNGFDGLIAHCTTVRTSSCCCGTSICAFSLRREDEFKDPLDHFPEGGPGEYEDRYNYVSLVKLDGGASTFLQRNWFRFTIECPTNLSWSKTSCK
ncbi:MAG: hypothetical protein KDI51_00405 [Xanthomonadales bacterium]|nr:hypothetical protein [Xanthomonadales bacterium]